MSGCQAKQAPPHLSGSYMVLETTNRCPLKCGHCAVAEAPFGHPHYRTLEHMPLGMVRELLQDLRANGLTFDNLVMFWLGEPLSHPEFPALYELVLEWSGRGEIFKKIEVHTNTFPLDDGCIEAALNDAPVPQVWHLTMDAARRETFKVIKGLDAFDKSQRQALRMVKRKGERKARWPKLAAQFIVSDVNAGEAEEFVEVWSRAYAEAGLPSRVTGFHVPVDGPENYIYLKSLDCPTAEEQDRQNRVYAGLMKRLGLVSPVDPDAPRRIGAEVPRTLLTPCSGFWKSPTIGSDGRVTVCTRDNTHHNAIGSLREASFSALWLRSRWLNRRRQQVARGDYSELPYCQTCFIPSSVNYSGITEGEIAAFQRSQGLDGVLVQAPPGLPPHATPYPLDWAGPARAQVYEDRTGARPAQGA
jgi:organic radical activating enzyme